MNDEDSASDKKENGGSSEKSSRMKIIYWYAFLLLAFIGDLFIIIGSFFSLHGFPANIFPSRPLTIGPIFILFAFPFGIAALYSLFQYNSLRKKDSIEVPGRNTSIIFFIIAVICLNCLFVSSGLNTNYTPSQELMNQWYSQPEDYYILVNTSNLSWNPGSDIFILNYKLSSMGGDSEDYDLGYDLTFIVPNQTLDASKLRVFITSENKTRVRSVDPEELGFIATGFAPGKWRIQGKTEGDTFFIWIWPSQKIFPGDKCEITLVAPNGKTFMIKDTVKEVIGHHRYEI